MTRLPRPILVAAAAIAVLSIVAYVALALGGRAAPAAAEPLPDRIAADAELSGDRAVPRGGTTVLADGAKLTVTGRLEVAGTLRCADGELYIRVLGELTVSGSLTCDVGGKAPPGAGISIVARGNVTFSPDAVVETDGSVQVVDDAEQLARTQADVDVLFDEIGRDTGDGVRIGPFLPQGQRSAQRARPASSLRDGSLSGSSFQQPRDLTLRISGKWRVAGPFTWIHHQGVRNVELGDLAMTHSSGPRGADQVNCPAALGGDGGHAGRLLIRAREMLRIYSDVKITLGSGGAGGDATAHCYPAARAVGGRGGTSGQLKLQAGSAMVIEADLRVDPGGGGPGGSAVAVGLNAPGPGLPGGAADAVAGRGGNSAGRLQLLGNAVGVDRIEVGSVVGGDGGDADATGGDGADNVGCGADGGAGGKTAASGGDGGGGAFHAPGAEAPRSGTSGERPTPRPTQDPRRSPVPQRGTGAATWGGEGGDAVATGGDGGNGGDCGPDGPGGAGGGGGNAQAVAGTGGIAVLVVRGVAEVDKGPDGAALLPGGDGGDGGDGCPPGVGGARGDGAPPGKPGAPGKDVHPCVRGGGDPPGRGIPPAVVSPPPAAESSPPPPKPPPAVSSPPVESPRPSTTFTTAGSWVHGTGTSTVCARITSQPPLAGAQWEGVIRGPGVVTPSLAGNLDDSGSATARFTINLFGSYTVTFSVTLPDGSARQLVQTVNVVAGPGPALSGCS